MKRHSLLSICLLILSLSSAPWAAAGDWPMFRADAARSGFCHDSLPASLELRWIYRSPAPKPAWPNSVRARAAWQRGYQAGFK